MPGELAVNDRVPIAKTYKLFIGGAFPRSESGRSYPVRDERGAVVAHACLASRKDLRNAVEAAHGVRGRWAGADALLRGQVLYRVAEMAEGKRGELVDALRAQGGVSERDALRETDASIDRLVSYAGWTDKIAQVLGCANPVAGPYHNFTIPEPSGVVGVVCPDEVPLLGLISLAAPILSAGGVVVALASGANPVPAMVLAECFATGDVPGGAMNILTGDRDELIEHLAGHRDVIGIHAAGTTPEQTRMLRCGAAENLKRVAIREIGGDGWFDRSCQGPGWIEPFLEFKTLWHPSSA